MSREIENLKEKLHLNNVRKVGERTLFCGYGSFSGMDFEGWQPVNKWSNGFREVMANKSLLSTLTYCEGDLILSVSPNRETYIEEIKSAREFYKNN